MQNLGRRTGNGGPGANPDAVYPDESGVNVKVPSVVKGPGIPETPAAGPTGLAPARFVSVTPEVTLVHFRSSCHS